jgi:hypothetical protein
MTPATIGVVAPEPVVVAPSVVVAAPVVEVAPVSYVWDGVEFVGEYNGGYVCLNGGAWVVCDPVVLERFHGFERFHGDWRSHAIRNEGAHRLGGRGGHDSHGRDAGHGKAAPKRGEKGDKK